MAKIFSKVVNSAIQGLIVGYLDGKGVSQRGVAGVADVSPATYGTYRRMESGMGIEIMEKILAAYPELKRVIADYLTKDLTSNTAQNITQEDIKPQKVEKFEDELNQVRKNNRNLNELLDQYRSDKSRLEKELAQLKQRMAELEEENKKLKSSAPANDSKK